jgi:hypothetical protein
MAIEQLPKTAQESAGWRPRNLPVVSRVASTIDRISEARAQVQLEAERQRADQVSGARAVLEERFQGFDRSGSHAITIPTGPDTALEFQVDFYENGDLVLSTEVSNTVQDRYGDQYLDTELVELNFKPDNTLASTTSIIEHMSRGLRGNFAIGDYPADPKDPSFDPSPKPFAVSTTDIAIIKNGAKVGIIETVPVAV